MTFLLDHHIEIITSIYVFFHLYFSLYVPYFKTNNTDNINLIELYNKHRGL